MPYFLQGSFWDPNLWCEVQSMQNVGDEEHADLLKIRINLLSIKKKH
jgi:hypothetical protein